MAGKATDAFGVAAPLLGALAQTSAVIGLGYLLRRLNLITYTDSNAIKKFCGRVALPAIFFVEIAKIDWSVVDWAILLGMFAAKVIVFAIVALLVISRAIIAAGCIRLVELRKRRIVKDSGIVAIGSADDVGASGGAATTTESGGGAAELDGGSSNRGSQYCDPDLLGTIGLFCIMATKSNDIALGVPVVNAIWPPDADGETTIETPFATYLYLFAPFQLIILNVLGFVLMELNLRRRKERESADEERRVADETALAAKQQLTAAPHASIDESTALLRAAGSAAGDNDDTALSLAAAPSAAPFRPSAGKLCLAEFITAVKPIPRVLWNVITTPPVLSVIFGLATNIGLTVTGGTLPKVVIDGLEIIGNGYTVTALLAIGFGVYGSLERNVRFTSRQYVDGALLLFFKIGALAFVTNRTVNLFSENKTPADQERASEFGWLYGMIPVAPTVYIFAEMYEIHADFTAVMCTVCLVVAGPVMAVTGILLETYAKKGNGTPFSGLSVQLLQVGSDIGIILVFPLLLGWVFVRLFRSGVKVLHARTLARDPDGGSGVVSAAAIAAAPIKADPLRITLTALSRSFTTKYKYEEDEPASIDSVEVTSIDERQTAGFLNVVKATVCCASSRAKRARTQRGRVAEDRCLPRPRALLLALSCCLVALFGSTIGCVVATGTDHVTVVAVVRFVEQLSFMLHQCVGAAVALFLGVIGFGVALPPVSGTIRADSDIFFKGGSFRKKNRDCCGIPCEQSCCGKMNRGKGGKGKSGRARDSCNGAHACLVRALRCATIRTPHLTFLIGTLLAVGLPLFSTSFRAFSGGGTVSDASAMAESQNTTSKSELCWVMVNVKQLSSDTNAYSTVKIVLIAVHIVATIGMAIGLVLYRTWTVRLETMALEISNAAFTAAAQMVHDDALVAEQLRIRVVGGSSSSNIDEQAAATTKPQQLQTRAAAAETSSPTVPPSPSVAAPTSEAEQQESEEKVFVAKVAEAMMSSGSEGLERKDRVYGFTRYALVFKGNAAVSWLVESGFAQTREDAVALGGLLNDARVLHHVHDSHAFQDRPLFYRLYCDEEMMQRTTVLAPLDTMAAIDPSAVASAAFATATRAFTFSDLPELDQTPTARRWATHRFLPFEAAHDASALALSEHGGPHRENLSDLSEPLSPETLRMGSIGGEGAQHNGARSSMWRDTATSGGGGSIAPAQMGSGGAVLQSNIDALLSLGLPQLGHLRETGIVLSRKSAWLVHARDQAVDDVGRWTLLLLSMLAVSVISLVVNLPAVVNVAGPLAIEAQLASRTLVYAQSIFLFFTFGIHPTITDALKRSVRGCLGCLESDLFSVADGVTASVVAKRRQTKRTLRTRTAALSRSMKREDRAPQRVGRVSALSSLSGTPTRGGSRAVSSNVFNAHAPQLPVGVSVVDERGELTNPSPLSFGLGRRSRSHHQLYDEYMDDGSSEEDGDLVGTSGEFGGERSVSVGGGALLRNRGGKAKQKKRNVREAYMFG